MDLFFAMNVFARVVEANSFTRAADTLQIPKASATIALQQLEAHLKIRLLQRTTRSLSLTPEGAEYYERCIRILADVEDAEHAIAQATDAPRGRLRVDMPTALGKLVVLPQIYAFHARYPGIELMLGFGDKPVDLIQENVDCVIRVGTLPSSSMVAKRVGWYRPVTVASPAYLSRYGMPENLKDLDNHLASNFFWGRNGRLMDFSFNASGRTVDILMRGNLAFNDTEAWLQSCLNGIGIIQAPRFMTAPYLESGQLVELLKAYTPPPMPISAVYPQSRHVSSAVRLFVDWIAELFEKNALVAE